MDQFPPLGGEPSTCNEDRTIVIPVPYEHTTTYRKGTAEGPSAMLRASTQVELFDEELRIEPLCGGVETLPPVLCDEMPDVLANQLESICRPHVAAGRRIACLGGEHSVSLGAIRAVSDEPFGILQIDAHPDLRDEYEGTHFGHGCVMKRALDLDTLTHLVGVGLRAVSEEDDAVIQSDPRVRPHYAHALRGDWIDAVMTDLPERIYITFDLDGLDPSIVPGTGTPEPGGLAWWDALALLRRACTERTVVGFDVVELLPEPPSCVSDVAAARLIFKILGYLEAGKEDRTK
jgi:agmatinase